MQKKLIALAIAGLSGAAFAQSNVTIYGQMRVSVDHTDAQVVNSDVWTVSDRSSRIGFKGEEKLGSGMTAVWQWESALNSTNANNSAYFNTATLAAQRNTFLGLKGGFGEVRVGTHDTPYKPGGSADLFGDTAADMQCGGLAFAADTALDTNATNTAAGVTAGAGCIIGRNGFDNRLSNVIAYISPTWSGFHFAVAGVAGEGTGSVLNNAANSLTDAYSMVAVYANGPLTATLGHEVASADGVSYLVGVAGMQKAAATKLNLAYKIGAIGLGYTHESSQDIGVANGGDSSKDVGQVASVSYAMGATTLGLQWGRFNDKDVADADRTNWALGAYHALSKRTQAYVGYARIDPKGDNNNLSIFTAGLNHTF